MIIKSLQESIKEIKESNSDDHMLTTLITLILRFDSISLIVSTTNTIITHYIIITTNIVITITGATLCAGFCVEYSVSSVIVVVSRFKSSSPVLSL